MDKIIEQVVKDLVTWLPREAIRDNLPETFSKTGKNKCQVILDCAEVLTERPKPLDCQTATWSDYKHYLVGILPSGYIFDSIFIETT